MYKRNEGMLTEYEAGQNISKETSDTNPKSRGSDMLDKRHASAHLGASRSARKGNLRFRLQPCITVRGVTCRFIPSLGCVLSKTSITGVFFR